MDKRPKEPLVFFRTSELLERAWEADAWLAFCRMMALARQRRACTPATYPAAVLELDRRDLCWLLGRPRIDYAMPILAAVQAMHEVVLTSDRGLVLRPSSDLAQIQLGASFKLTIAKYAEMQRFTFRRGGTTNTPRTPTPQAPRRPARRVVKGKVLTLDEQGHNTIDEWLADQEDEA